jgi:hypothetical protein
MRMPADRDRTGQVHAGALLALGTGRVVCVLCGLLVCGSWCGWWVCLLVALVRGWVARAWLRLACIASRFVAVVLVVFFERATDKQSAANQQQRDAAKAAKAQA